MPSITMLSCGVLAVSCSMSAIGQPSAAAGRDDRPSVPAAPFGILFVDNTHNHPEAGEGIPHAERKGLNLFAYNGMAGIAEYVQWSQLEPEEGKYRSSGVFSLLRLAKAHGKKLALGVICGRHVPKWYKARHAGQVFRYRVVQRREDIGHIERPAEAVLPWIGGGPDEAAALNTTFDCNLTVRKTSGSCGAALATRRGW